MAWSCTCHSHQDRHPRQQQQWLQVLPLQGTPNSQLQHQRQQVHQQHLLLQPRVMPLLQLQTPLLQLPQQLQRVKQHLQQQRLPQQQQLLLTRGHRLTLSSWLLSRMTSGRRCWRSNGQSSGRVLLLHVQLSRTASPT